MANIIKRVWNQNRMVQIEDLRGMTFQAEAAGHTFQISGIDDDGNTVALTGTPSGVLLRPDNTDVALTCSVSGGVVSATLPANCYDVPGRFGLTIFITSGSSKTAIYAAVGTVTRTSSGTVAPGTSQSVVDLINAINAAVNSIPASYSALLADIAPTYSDSALYSVGQYAWYDGDLKRCIVPITTAESYTAAHWTSAVLGQDVSDLKSAINLSLGKVKALDFENATVLSGIIMSNNKWSTTNGYYKSYKFTVSNAVSLHIKANANEDAVVGLLKNDTLVNNTTPNFCEGISGRISVTSGGEQDIPIPNDCTTIIVEKSGSSNIDKTPAVANLFYYIVAPAVDSTLSVQGYAADAKVTGDKISAINTDMFYEAEINIGKYETHGFFINSSDRWSTTGNSKNIPCTDLVEKKITIKANTSNDAVVGFIKSVGSSGYASFADGTSRITITAGTSETYDIPNDCNYINITTITSTGTVNRVPEVIKTPMRTIPAISNGLKSEGEKIDNVVFPSPSFDAEIVGFICYGQSWSMGYDALAIPAIQRYDNVMLDSGLMNNPVTDMTVSASSLIPLIEQNVSASSQTCGETPCTAQTDIVKQLLIDENGISPSDVKYQIFSAAPGMGNRSIEQLSKGSDYYTRMMDVISTANTIARSQGKVFVVPAISWAQGRSSEHDSTYYDLLENLRLDIDGDIKAITGQTIDVKLIAWQAVTGGSTTPKRYYDRTVYASEKYENIICCGTFYYLNHVANANLHLTPDSQDWLGTQFGIAYKRSIIDGEKFIPLKPKKVEVYGNIAYLDFYVPVKPLVFDTTLVASISNYGFQMFDNSDTEKTISSVSIVAPDRIKIVCADTIATTDHIVYGGNGGSNYSPTTGKRGNLRDSQQIVYTNHAANNLPCYNWCVVFDKTIAELTASNSN